MASDLETDVKVENAGAWAVLGTTSAPTAAVSAGETDFQKFQRLAAEKKARQKAEVELASLKRGEQQAEAEESRLREQAVLQETERKKEEAEREKQQHDEKEQSKEKVVAGYLCLVPFSQATQASTIYYFLCAELSCRGALSLFFFWATGRPSAREGSG